MSVLWKQILGTLHIHISLITCINHARCQQVLKNCEMDLSLYLTLGNLDNFKQNLSIVPILYGNSVRNVDIKNSISKNMFFWNLSISTLSHGKYFNIETASFRSKKKGLMPFLFGICQLLYTSLFLVIITSSFLDGLSCLCQTYQHHVILIFKWYRNKTKNNVAWIHLFSFNFYCQLLLC